MTYSYTQYKANIVFSLNEKTPELLEIEFLPGSERASFGEVSQTTGECFFAASSQNAGVLRVSLGKEETIRAESFRVAASAAVKWMRNNHVNSAFVSAPSPSVYNGVPVLEAIVEGAILGDYRFTSYRSSEERPAKLALTLDQDVFAGKADALARSIITAETVCQARDWSHEPANVINPIVLAELAGEVSKKHHLKFRVYEDKELEMMGAEAILAVGKGSATPARMIVLEHPGEDAQHDQPPVVLVGKAITFDTGGYSIKNGEGIRGMKYDKCGGIDVLATLMAASELHLKQRVVGIIGAAENSISGNSYKPDDILRTLSGKTVEIISTDAEGRLVLSDCLSFGQKEFRPRALIDLATLTSGVITALGRVRAGLFSSNDALADSLIQSGEEVNERLWELPLDDEYLASIKGDDADLKNAGGKEGHPILAAIFLKQFVSGETPWAHLDIAGMADTPRELPYCTKGATGFGIRLLLNYLGSLE